MENEMLNPNRNKYIRALHVSVTMEDVLKKLSARMKDPAYKGNKSFADLLCPDCGRLKTRTGKCPLAVTPSSSDTLLDD
jgi:hypothetical protein